MMTSPGEPRPCVLVVDDDRDIRDTLELLLDSEGYRAVAAVDGLHALSVVDHERPDVILLDMAMPGLDGPGFCSAYRSRGGAAPIVFVTAALPTAAAAAVEGCDAASFVAKPFEIDELLETVARCLALPA
jgi:CheY-like chemotaxis protein